MKTAWNNLKGACLLLFGLATGVPTLWVGGSRGIAADIQFTSFDKLATSTSDAAPGEASTGPFKEEPAPSPAGAASTAAPSHADTYTPSYSTGNDFSEDAYLGAPGRFWFHADYMHWWTSGAKLPPLVSTYADPNDPNPNANLITVFGDRDVGSGDHDGYRIGLGMWLDCAHHWGIEGEYFDLSGRPVSYDSGLSNGYDNLTFRPLVRPYVDPTNGAIVSNPVAQPSLYTGRVTVDYTDYFQSAGLWLRRNLRAREWSDSGEGVPWTAASARTFRLDAIAGYRFTRLMDSVAIRDDEMDVAGANVSLNNWNLYTNIDTYSAVNNFNGAELGLDAVMTRGRFSLDIMAKAALGVNNQDVQLYGLARIDQSVQTGGQQGSIVQSSGTFDFSRNVFSWIPELTVTAGYQLTEYVKFTVGYDIMYWSSVVRAGNQIAEGQPSGYPNEYLSTTAVTGVLAPYEYNQTYFWAQGIRLGGEVRF